MKPPAAIDPQRLAAHLRGLLGSEVIHQGVRCQLFEILAEGPSLVLQDCETRALQNNQFGGPWRRVPAVYTIPLTTPDGTALHPLFIALNLPPVPH